MKDGYKLEYLSSCLDSSMNKDYSVKSTSLLLTIGSDTDRDNNPYAMGDIANIAIKIYDDLDPSFYVTMVCRILCS